MTKNKYDHKTITLGLIKYAGVTPRFFDLLLQSFGSLDEILLAEESELAAIEGISPGLASRVAHAPDHLEKANNDKAVLSKKNINIITRFDINYPSQLMEINDPPPLIYSRGEFLDEKSKTVALIGAALATQAGLALTTKTAKELVTKKVQVLSALDQGISTAAHLGCKAAGGHSFAVIDCGLDSITGDAAVPLAIDIIRGGGIISEYGPDRKFEAKNFGEANRLLVGLSQAVIITEFHESSRRVHDILEYCHQIGKLCFVLIDPAFGPLTDKSSLARAVKQGAILMTGPNKIDDIFKALV